MCISKVNNLSKKSFSNYSGPKTNEEFKEINIIFGYNGRGKTSLALGIIDEFLKDKSKTEDNYRFYSKSYISDNLLLKESDDLQLKGVKANFGKKNVDAEKEIEKIEKNIVDTDKIENDIKKMDKETRDEINKIHDNKKGQTQIQRKSSNKTIDEIINLYKKDVIETKKIIESDDELIRTTGDGFFEKQKLKIDTLKISNINLLDNNEVIKISEIFDINFDDINIPTSEIISWLNDGIKIHNEGDNCKFCGGNTDIKKIRDITEKYNRNEKQMAILKLIAFEKKLSQIKKEVTLIKNQQENIIANLGEKIEVCFDIITENIKEMDTVISIVQDKIDDINKKVKFNGEELENGIVKSIYESVEKIIQEKDVQSKELQDKINKLSVLIKGAIGLEIERSTLIKNNLKLIKEKEQELDNYRKQNNNYYKKIDELKKSKSNTNDFANHINSILPMLEINLKLDVIDDNYIIKHCKSNEMLKVSEISEGEQNLLALLFFYYELFNDKEQKELKNVIELIIIDDPISSVDDINKMYVLELIKKLCLLTQPQLFIFTHVWEDFSNICYGKEDKNNTPFRFYEIKKDQKGSSITLTKTNETPYKHGFKEIYNFSQKNNCNNLSDCEIYHYPNIMRKILEEFLRFKIKNNSPTQNNFNNIKNVLCSNNANSNDELMIGTMLNVCNIFSHKISRNPDEILKSAKYLMKKIEQVDKQHFNTMKQ